MDDIKRLVDFDGEEVLCRLTKLTLLLPDHDMYGKEAKYLAVYDWESINEKWTTKTAVILVELNEDLVHLGFSNDSIDQLFRKYNTDCVQVFPEVKMI
jgi:hypothetical protein